MALSVTNRGVSSGAGFSRSVATFTPANGSLLVAVYEGCYHASGSPLTNASVSGGGLTWTKRVETTYDWFGNERTFVTIWTAPVATGSSTTVSASNSGASSDGTMLQVFEITGQDASPIGATATGQQGTTSDTTFSMDLSAAPASDSWVVAGCAIQNWEDSNPITNGSGWAEVAEQATGSSTWSQVQTRTGSTSQAVAWGTLNVNGQFGSAESFAALEIKASSGASPISGSLSKTLGAVTLSASGQAAIAGAVDVALEDITVSGAGVVANASGLASTLEDAALSASGAVAISGALSAVLADAAASAVAVLAINGALTAALGDVSLSADGAVAAGPGGAFAATMEDASVAASGAVALSAAVDASLDDAAVSADGAVALSGALSVTLDDLGVLLTGALRLNAGLSSILDDLTLNSAGALRLSGYLSTTLADTIVEAVGTLISGPHGSLSVTLENISVEAVGSVIVTSVAEISLELLSINASGALEISGELVVTLDELISVASGYEPGTIVRVPRRAVLSPRLSLSGRIVLAGRLKI